MSDPKKPNNNRDLPAVNKDGTIHASNGIGPIKYTPRRPPLDLEEAKKRGLVPESELSYDQNDPNSLANIGYRKFGPDEQQTYLELLAKHGRHKLAAMCAKVTPGAVSAYAEKDPVFKQLRQEAFDLYHEMTAAIILAQARDGMKDIRYDKDGRVTSVRTSYETQIRKMMVTRADPTYTETQKSEVAVTGGAVIVPAPVENVESWDAIVSRYTGKNGTEQANSTEQILDTIGVPSPQLGPGAEPEKG